MIIEIIKFYALQSGLLKEFNLTKDQEDELKKLFQIKFDLSIAETDLNEYEKQKNKLTENTQDKIFKVCINIIDAIVRTNYCLNKDFLSIKILSHKIENLSNFVPFAETVVIGNNFQAIHIRGGKVARGGIRFSNRKSDLRTEVLELMKTQCLKNSIIVPTGAKGGFVVDNPDNKETVLECYKKFICGILDITDNIIDQKITKPLNVKCLDDDDYYLVVAADKGTSHYSDYANEIAHNYNFWLGDAFASGGKNGYDHKKLGITAKGTWESIKRHLYDLNINLNSELSVIAIGSMTGDVTGNGLIETDQIKLIASIGSNEIFIDYGTNYNSEKALNERIRLFNLEENGKWSKYDKNLLNGVVLDKKTQSAEIPYDVFELLSIEEVCDIKRIQKNLLCFNVDILFNGGVGTFVRASHEKDEDVKDIANDDIRVTGIDLNAKIFAEGGNLGMTQQGRVEYDLMGGKVNTDFIDNSAGVNCSDYEVNIKIALSSIDKIKRDELIKKATEEVCFRILLNNFNQAKAISLIENQYNENEINDIVNMMTSIDIVKPEDCMPNIDELKERRNQLDKGYSRPEIAVLLNKTKSYLKAELMKEKSLFEIKSFYNVYLAYFPIEIFQEYKDLLLNHPLKNEILCATLTNDIVDNFGFIEIFNLIYKNKLSVFDIYSRYFDLELNFELDELLLHLSESNESTPIQFYALYKEEVLKIKEKISSN